jgi:hypothetical protein
MSQTMTHNDLMKLEAFLVSQLGLSHYRADLAIRAVREKLLRQHYTHTFLKLFEKRG